MMKSEAEMLEPELYHSACNHAPKCVALPCKERIKQAEERVQSCKAIGKWVKARELTDWELIDDEGEWTHYSSMSFQQGERGIHFTIPDVKVPVTFALLDEISRAFGTREINVLTESNGGGCDSCGYGGGTNTSIEVFNAKVPQ